MEIDENDRDSNAASRDPLHAVVVGASLSGLMTALTLARAGARVTVLERAGADRPSGAAIRVDADLISRLTGRVDDERRRRSATPSTAERWSDVYCRLRDAALVEGRIALRHETRVVTVMQDADCAWVETDSGETVSGHTVVGADGHRSVVRRAVAPQRPDAAYAGYVLWIGVADEGASPSPRSRPRDMAYLTSADGVLLGYSLPGADGSAEHGDRRLGWAWFDATRDDLLHTVGAVVDGVVQHSLAPGAVPEATLRELATGASARWGAPWSDAIRDSVARGEVTGIPIAEYLPDTLARGRLVLVGDAAHVPTPMTGTGFTESLLDAEALADVLTATPRDRIEEALAEYERRRLPAARDLVEFGQDFSRSFVRGSA